MQKLLIREPQRNDVIKVSQQIKYVKAFDQVDTEIYIKIQHWSQDFLAQSLYIFFYFPYKYRLVQKFGITCLSCLVWYSQMAERTVLHILMGFRESSLQTDVFEGFVKKSTVKTAVQWFSIIERVERDKDISAQQTCLMCVHI